jgi:hypothetical protein
LVEAQAVTDSDAVAEKWVWPKLRPLMDTASGAEVGMFFVSKETTGASYVSLLGERVPETASTATTMSAETPPPVAAEHATDVALLHEAERQLASPIVALDV